jgi:hypothetical protein
MSDNGNHNTSCTIEGTHTVQEIQHCRTLAGREGGLLTVGLLVHVDAQVLGPPPAARQRLHLHSPPIPPPLLLPRRNASSNN